VAVDVETRSWIEGVAKWWWLWIVFGVLWIVISLIILQFNESSARTVGIIVGLMFLAAGIQEFFVAALAEGWKWLWVTFGVVFVIAGIVALAYPKRTFGAIADMLGWLFFFVGVFWIIEAVMTRETNPLWWLGLIAGVLMVIMAFWTAGQFFFTRAYVLLVFAGIWALMHGITDIFKAFAIRRVGKISAAA
jgi:uncharacterized membrane protein HdeD (DUF308 family)